MNITKKQLKALTRITERNGRYPGLIPVGERCAITDGYSIALFTTNPAVALSANGFPFGEPSPVVEEWVHLFDDVDTGMVEHMPTVEDCKQAVQAWKQMSSLGKPERPTITIHARDEIGKEYVSSFDARYLRDVLEAAGTHHVGYLGRPTKSNLPWPVLMVYQTERGDSWPANWNEPVILLPCRP